ncbi:malate synthase G [Bacillus salacetis]|uniref:Malate synthase G n=1 Tax=Bacillus salacetis TaxID=2315464 RepID=A0A3A1QYY2_9BACI|nr:malate synthase G [Bacillus salacetis]RIW34041.1 malate synthase G [Bacillus salacetis]
MEGYVNCGEFKVAGVFYDFINSEVLPGSGVEDFWIGFEKLVKELTPENKALLQKRDDIQMRLNEWHLGNPQFDQEKYRGFLQEINYLEAEAEDFAIATENVDDEIAIQAGPQLVVPVNNARYAINAANARWGSLYDALYGTDAIPEEGGYERGASYNPRRGEEVIAFAKQYLDDTIPLTAGSHSEVVNYRIVGSKLQAHLEDGSMAELMDPLKLTGYNGTPGDPSVLLMKNNNLHLELVIDRNDPIGSGDKAGVKDIVMESAVTTIMDCEDSVAAVDAEDKVEVYRNWLGLLTGTLTTSFQKGDRTVVRSLEPDRTYTSMTGSPFSLRGRSLLFVRNVGHLMTTNAVLDQNGDEILEGILDGVITSLIAKHELLHKGDFKNSTKGSVYIVKPKMHGSEEAAFANKLFNRIEDLLGLERYTLKIGVMDEERRTSLNLKNCIKEVKDRVAFINTGFLDRTGDEIHTSMEAGIMCRKNEMKTTRWLQAYEWSNVHTGLAAGFQGKAQIGKGMWAMPDRMAEMMEQKIVHLEAGATTAWVPSPAAATLHALHYHQLDVRQVQKDLKKRSGNREEMLVVPVVEKPAWSQGDIQQELDNNIQGILGYVVRWVNQGIGCSKVPDIHYVGLMEDRATLRISSQHVANWLHHNVCSAQQVKETLERMAEVVDKQNEGDPHYQPMSPDFQNSVAFQAAAELIFAGYKQPNGYTEPILHRRRLEAKASAKKVMK